MSTGGVAITPGLVSTPPATGGILLPTTALAPLAGASVSGVMLYAGVNFWNSAVSNGAYVPPSGFGNSAAAAAAASSADNVPVDDNQIEFAFRNGATSATADVQTSGVVTLSYTADAFASTNYTLSSAAFAQARGFTVLANTFETAWITLQTSLAGSTLSINVPGIASFASPVNLVISIRLDFSVPVSYEQFLAGCLPCASATRHHPSRRLTKLLPTHSCDNPQAAQPACNTQILSLCFLRPQCTEGPCCVDGTLAPATTQCRCVSLRMRCKGIG